MCNRFLLVVSFVLSQLVRMQLCDRPNIVMIIADDMGWNDVGFHSGDVQTPNIDALAYHGVILTRHYSQPVCSPSRTALLTGDYPFRHGMQGMPCSAGMADGLRTGVKLMPEYFSKLGYKSHLVGKWHIGYETPEQLPTRRGFDTFFGYLNGYLGYWDGTHYISGRAGRDMRRNENGAWREAYGKYLTDFITEEAVRVINNHQGDGGMLLIVGEAAVHATSMSMPHEAPLDVKNTTKRGYLRAMAEKLDWSVGEIVLALKNKQILNNTIIIFISDNGAPTELIGFPNAGSNWPMRGIKSSVHEGGVRTIAAAWSTLFKNLSRVSHQLFHITDWLPTLYAAAGGSPKDLEIYDGINQWPFLESALPGARDTIVIDIDDVHDCEAVIQDHWKLIKNHGFDNEMKYTDCYYGENGGWMAYNDTLVKNSVVAKTIGDLPIHYRDLRRASTIQSVCSDTDSSVAKDCNTQYCLYDVFQDPTECHNVAPNNPDIVDRLKSILDDYRKHLIPNKEKKHDDRANPENWDDYWSPWLNTNN